MRVNQKQRFRHSRARKSRAGVKIEAIAPFIQAFFPQLSDKQILLKLRLALNYPFIFLKNKLGATASSCTALGSHPEAWSSFA